MNSSCLFEGHEYRMRDHEKRVQADLVALAGRRDFDKPAGKRDCTPKTVDADFRIRAFLAFYNRNTTADLTVRLIESLMDSLRPIRRPDLVAQWSDRFGRGSRPVSPTSRILGHKFFQ